MLRCHLLRRSAWILEKKEEKKRRKVQLWHSLALAVAQLSRQSWCVKSFCTLDTQVTLDALKHNKMNGVNSVLWYHLFKLCHASGSPVNSEKHICRHAWPWSLTDRLAKAISDRNVRRWNQPECQQTVSICVRGNFGLLIELTRKKN